jgi:hypothetical protein
MRMLRHVVIALGLEAVAHACPVQVQVRDGSTAWEAAAETVRAELAIRPDVDRCVEIEVAPSLAGARITVWFEDGRRATRDVASPRQLRAAILVLVLAIDPVAQPLELHVPPAPDAPPMPDLDLGIHDVPEVDEHVGLAIGGELGAEWTGTQHGEALGMALRGSRGPWNLGVAVHASRSHIAGAIGFTANDVELTAELGDRVHVGAVPLTVFAGPRIAWLGQELDRALPPSYVTVANPKTGASEMVPVDDTRQATVLRASAGIRAELVAGRRFALGVVARAAADVTSDVANRLTTMSVRTPELATWSCELAFEGEVQLWR